MKDRSWVRAVRAAIHRRRLPAGTAAPAGAVFAVATAVVFYDLGDRPLWWWDESFYANAAQNAIEGGHWLIPHLAGFDTIHPSPFLEKPPLAIWLEALSIGVFGPTEVAVRIPSALAAVGVTVLLYFVGRELRGNAAGLVAAAVFLTTPAVLVGTNAARFGATDMLHTLFGSLLVTLVWIHATGRRDVHPALVGGVASALFLTKGFAAGAFLLALFPLPFLHRERFSLQFVGVATAVTTVAVGWWVAAAYLIAGDYFLEEIFLEPVWNRIVGADTAPTDRGTLVPLFESPYLTRLQSAFRPWWFLFLVGAVVTAATGRDRHSADAAGLSPRFLVWWAGAVLAPFLFFGTKMWYVIPTFVPAALTVGWLVGTALDGRSGGSDGFGRTRTAAVVGLVLGTALAALAGSDGRLYDLADGRVVPDVATPDVTVVAVVAVLCAGAWLLAVDATRRGSIRLGGGYSFDVGAFVRALTVGAVLAVVVVALAGAPSVYAAGNGDERADTEFRRLGETTATAVPAGERVYVQPNAAARWFFASYGFYADRPMERVPVERLRTDPEVRYALVTTQGVPIVSDRDPTVLAESRHLELVLVELDSPGDG